MEATVNNKMTITNKSKKWGDVDFEFFANWFGNRGCCVEPDHFKAIGLDDTMIYWIPDNETCNDLLESENQHEDMVLWAPIHSLWFEVEDETTVERCPFRFE